MKKIIHTLPLFIRDFTARDEDLNMVVQCLRSLGASAESSIVIYNQGCLSNMELHELCLSCGIAPVIIGEGINIGIAKARQACFEYIGSHYPETPFISEIHVDMLFPPDWYAPLTDYLQLTDEPMISPGIVTAYGQMQPTGGQLETPFTPADWIALLTSLRNEAVVEGFVHPVVHRAASLRAIGGYDTCFLRGKQGYEDDSLLLGYLYYMGTRTRWRPKCCLQSWVYHATMAQRMSLPDKHLEFSLNEQGLFLQYGAYGLKQLSAIHYPSVVFDQLFSKYIPFSQE